MHANLLPQGLSLTSPPCTPTLARPHPASPVPHPPSPVQARALGLDLFVVPLGDEKGNGGYAEAVCGGLRLLQAEVAAERCGGRWVSGVGCWRGCVVDSLSPACLPAYLSACSSACLLACSPACLLARLPACSPASPAHLLACSPARLPHLTSRPSPLHLFGSARGGAARQHCDSSSATFTWPTYAHGGYVVAAPGRVIVVADLRPEIGWRLFSGFFTVTRECTKPMKKPSNYLRSAIFPAVSS